MNGCGVCGGFGDRHDPIAHGTEREPLRLRIWKYQEVSTPEPWTWAIGEGWGEFWEGNTARTWRDALETGCRALRRADQ